MFTEGNFGFKSGVFNVSNSGDFESTTSLSHAKRTFEDGDRRQCTFSFWLKRESVGAAMSLYESSGAFEVIRFTSSNTIQIRNNNSDCVSTNSITSTSAWQHLVVTFDNDQGTASNRTRTFINGSEDTYSSSAFPAENANFTDTNDDSKVFQLGAANTHSTPNQVYDGLMAEVIFLDGTAVTNTNLFAETVGGVYRPKDTSSGLTYGTNGFRLDFSGADMGTDSGTESNDVTDSNITQSTDTPP